MEQSNGLVLSPLRRLVRAGQLGALAARSFWRGPLSVGDKELAKWFSSSPVSSTGAVVTEENALSYSAVWAAVWLISSQMGSLPLVLYKKSGGGKEKYDSHPLYRLLHDRPNPEMTSMVFRETLQAHALTYGNAYAEIQRDNGGRPAALWPLTPDRVNPVRDRIGQLRYRVSQISGGEVYLDPMDTLHVPGLGFDGITGYGVIDKMKESIGLGLATERFGGTFFGQGTTFGGVFEHPGKLSDLARKNFIESVNTKHQGVERAHRFIVVEEGMKYSRFGVDPDHAQFLETRTFQLDEVARWLNVPPHKLKNLLRATNNNIEHQNLEYYIDCLSPWCERWEQEYEYKLIAQSERNLQCIEHEVAGLLRGDSAGRGEFYSKRFNTASIRPNDIRSLENENPIAGGDEAFVPLNMIPLSLARPYFEAEIESKKASAEQARRPPAAPQPTPTIDPTSGRALEVMTEERDLARRKAQEAEDARDRVANELQIVSAAAATAAAGAQDEIATLRTSAAGLTDRLDRLTLEQATAQEALDGARAVSSELEARLAALTSDVAEAAALRETATRDLVTARERIVLIEADYQRVCGERQTLEAQRETDLAILAEVRGQIAALTGQVDTLQTTAIEAREALAVAQARASDLDAARETAVQAQTVTETARHAVEARLAAATAAVRAAVVDRLSWMVAHESDRARSQHGSPEKLKNWMETFYTGFGHRCRDILRPTVRAWITCVNHPEPAELVLDRLLAEYLSTSTRTLGALVGAQDADALPAALEQVLRRWAHDRPTSLADAVLAQTVEATPAVAVRASEPPPAAPPALPPIYIDIHQHATPAPKSKSVRFVKNPDGSLDSAVIEDED